MNPERRQLLEQLPGWSWDPHGDSWKYGFSRLKEYAERPGLASVSR